MRMHLEGVKNAYRRVVPYFLCVSLRSSAPLRLSALTTSLPQRRRGTQRLAEKRFQNKTHPTAGDARIDLDRNHDRGAGLA